MIKNDGEDRRMQNTNNGNVNSDLCFKATCISDVAKLLNEIFSKKRMALGISKEDIFELARSIISDSGFMDDIIQFAKNDPAAKGSYSYVYNSYKGIRSMMYYRVAKAILNWDALCDVDRGMKEIIVRDLCERGKVETGVDIHPLAEIGEGCVIDHGIGTRIIANPYEGKTVVTGETTIIGKNCTILNDVVIGAADVNKGPSHGRRHPCIGNNVTICAGVKILGKINVGDNVFIGPGCRIVHDIPSNTKVFIVNQLQIMKVEDEVPVIVDGVVFNGKNLLLYGENIREVDIILVDEQYNERKDLFVTIIEREDFYITFTIQRNDGESICVPSKKYHLKVILGDKYYFISSQVIERFLKRL